MFDGTKWIHVNALFRHTVKPVNHPEPAVKNQPIIPVKMESSDGRTDTREDSPVAVGVS